MDETSLVDFVANVVGEGPLRVEESLGDGFVRLRVAEAERRQAKHDIRCTEDIAIELLRNARDAGARAAFFATAREGSQRTIVCIDDGSGIPQAMRERVFEARVTSKLDTMCMDRWGVHGRGMALYSVKENALDARVRASGTGLGTALSVLCDCDELGERADQSTWPQVGKDETGELAVMRGPHNIIRTVVEFALDTRRTMKTYFGTPTDILCALVEQGRRALWDEGVFEVDEEAAQTLPFWMRPAAAPDARGLAMAAEQLGLAVSDRTCYRILNGELEPPTTVLATVQPQRGSTTGRAVDLLKDRRGLKVSKTDMDDFASSLERAFNTLGDRYYLSLRDRPRIKIAGETVTVTFQVEKDS